MWLGSELLIDGAVKLGSILGVSDRIISITVVAFGTSVPELLVSLISSYQGYNDLALGNIVGSNISNIGLVLAVSTFIFYYLLNSNVEPENDANSDSYVMLLAVLLLFIFAGDKLLTTPNPDVNEDMKMFEMLGLNPQKPFTKISQPKTVEAEDSQFESLGEKPRWSRPEHKIERNLVASGKKA